MFGQYKRLTNRYEAGVLTGKGLAYGGSRARTEATGYGATYFVQSMLSTKAQSFEGRRVSVSGSGNVAIYVIEKVSQFGGKVVACSNSNGYVVDDNGIDLAVVKEIKEVRRGRISEYVSLKPHARYIDGGSIWDVPCDVAMPSATQNELTGKEARTLISNGVVAVGEGANMPCTPEAVRGFREAGILSLRAKPPMQAASPPRRWRCSRMLRAIAGRSSRPKQGLLISCAIFTTAAQRLLRNMVRRAITCSAPISPASCASQRPWKHLVSSELVFGDHRTVVAAADAAFRPPRGLFQQGAFT